MQLYIYPDCIILPEFPTFIDFAQEIQNLTLPKEKSPDMCKHFELQIKNRKNVTT